MSGPDISNSRGRRASENFDDYPPALLQQLQLIDPSPIASPILSPVQPGYLDGTYPPHRGSAFYLIKIQRYTSYAFTSFLGLHIVTTGLLPLITPLESAENALLLSRVIYHAPIVETTLVLGSLTTHVLSGLVLRLHRRQIQYRKYGKITWARDMTSVQWTGYALVPIAAIHIAVTRLAPVLVSGGSEGIGLSFVSHGFARYPFLSWLFYTSLVGLGSYHVVKGWSVWLALPKRWTKLTNLMTASIACIWLTSTFRLSRIGSAIGHLGRHYDHIYRAISNFI